MKFTITHLIAPSKEVTFIINENNQKQPEKKCTKKQRLHD